MACWLLLNILGHVWNSSASLSILCIMRVLRRRRGQAYALLPSDSSPVSPWACSPTYRDLVTPRPLHQFLLADRPPYPLPLPILLPVRTGPFVMLFVHQLEQVGWDPDPVVTDTRALRRKHRPCDHEHIPLGPAHTQSTSFGRSDLILNFCLAAIAVLCHARLGDRFQVGSRRSYARGCTAVVYGVRPEWPKSLPTDIPQRIRQAANSFFNSVQVQQRITHHQAG